jgi:hypothetical protein
MQRIGCFLSLTLCLSAQASAKNPPPANLLADAKVQYCLTSESAGEKPQWQDEAPAAGGAVLKRWVFSIPESNSWINAAGASITLQTPAGVESCKVNGTSVEPPVKGMRYTIWPGLSPRLFHAGASNTLELPAGGASKSKGNVKGKKTPGETVLALLVRLPADLDFQTEAVLGDAGADYFSVGCRTNMLAQVTLDVDGKHWESPLGVVHSFKATGLKPGTEYRYKLTARIPNTSAEKAIGPFYVSTPPLPGKPFSFVAMGDSRTFPEDWKLVAKAVMRKTPAFVVFSGDMVADGREDRLWDEQFFGPAKAYFAFIPTLYIIGNHERASPLVGTLISAPGLGHWKTSIGGALFVGIDGAQDWTGSSANLKWMESVLKESREPYVFVCSHYPPWSSGPHGASNEGASVEARKYILPLMKKYGAAVFLAGHEHNYERCESPEGVTVIVSGGAGAPLYKRVLTPAENPYSKVFESTHNYCLFNIDGNHCSMQALTPEGRVIDTKSWPARKVKEAD